MCCEAYWGIQQVVVEHIVHQLVRWLDRMLVSRPRYVEDVDDG